MYTPVGSIARDMPFHDAIMLYFCLAVNGSLGSGGPGLGGSSSLSLCFPPLPPPPRSFPDAVELANLPRSQPIGPCRIARPGDGAYPRLPTPRIFEIFRPPAKAAVAVPLSATYT